MTLAEVQNLSDKELRLKIAEYFYDKMDCGICGIWWFRKGTETCGLQTCCLPCFESDLNAMYDIEKTLNNDRDANIDKPCTALYMCKLMETTRVDSKWASIHATARQRAEAFLLMMNEA